MGTFRARGGGEGGEVAAGEGDERAGRGPTSRPAWEACRLGFAGLSQNVSPTSRL